MDDKTTVYQVLLRAVIQYLDFKCVHDLRETSLPAYVKYREFGKYYCNNCGVITSTREIVLMVKKKYVRPSASTVEEVDQDD